ncbi:M56 family metallopeptidase [Polaribacter dokdonensis]|uniref:BlaR1 peptidase M56 n=1 Tax=Polaribacter dokdonensis DSW-5 TaxID=1300348 RepID=A0A0N0CEV5_9FLAO|nr:M56 family metallopeptidase [Polaribacter dokdonensis]KOY50980.1 BlaR1 peptidase M56 [Polaribacter dokdonensis DSW-5]SEE21445.1 BlaR1 peptidase M56 [Polaribacter dokdonensis DSW-5]
MINYIIQVILFQVLFLAIYDFFLSKETFFTKNRWYLLGTPILSFFIPLIKIPNIEKALPQEFTVNLPEIILSPEKMLLQTISSEDVMISNNYINLLFWAGFVLFSILFLVKLFGIITLIKKHKAQKMANVNLIVIPAETKAFSFFNYIFLGEKIKESNRANIIQHELVHSNQKHTYDLLLFEILKIVMWFNPMIYFFQKRITLVHEYISDAVVAKTETKETYINNLLSNFFQVENIAFINQFYKPSLIKKRIIMMKKKQSKKMNQLKYLLLIPVLASMLFYSSCATKPLKNEISNLENALKEQKEANEKQKVLLEQQQQVLRDSITLLNNQKEAKENELKNLQRKGFLNSINERTVVETETVSFMTIDKVPVFPGCEEGDKACFSKMVQKHFVKNFDSKMPKTLGLSPGKKRVFIGFKIDKEGDVVDIKARAPHPEIEKEVIRVMETLPKMLPGENEGKKVGVKYSIPFTLFVE